MKIVENQKSNLLLVIIGFVLLAAIGGSCSFYSNSKSQDGKSNANNSNTNKRDPEAQIKLYDAAPPGSQPPNTLGSPASPVVVEEFADFQCPTCALVYTKMKEINKIYGSRIKFIYRNFPLSQIHAHAYDAAIAAEAAGNQGKFWAMQDQLFSNQKEWSNSPDAKKLFEDYAQKIGLDLPKFQSDTLAITTKSRIDLDIERGHALKIQGTPTIFINKKEIPFELMDVGPLQRIIDSELQKANGQTTNQTQSNQTTNEKPAVQTTNGSAENSSKPDEKK
jgi:protein-disulfide isomerase